MACPNCGGELVSSLEIKGEVLNAEGELEEVVLQTVKPEGGVLVCSSCNQAATKEEDQEYAAEEAPVESNISPSPPRVEDLPAPEATEAAQALAEEEGIDLHEVEGTGAGGTITKGDVEGAT